ncbi:UNVERIFIED_CONTAM: hypothetical protein PYX00_009030 [Menopon gallinae]|uniref:Lipase domain-containing protein n=1 Tax=Menopon gallinae TaxID=328185 RepID=A0AAW2H9X8_9NEOP
MFAKSLPVILAISFVVNIAALENIVHSLDDLLGKDYVAIEDVEAARHHMAKRGYGYGRDWIVMPDGSGSPQIAILNSDFGNELSRVAPDDERFVDTRPPEETVRLQLFTRENPKNGESLNGTNLRLSIFDPSKPTKIVIHGWRSSGNSDTVVNIRNAYLNRSDVNVIAVDWSEPAGNVYYPASAKYTKKLGRYVAEIIDNLVESKGARYSDIHIVGHSLGAHASGVAGHFAKGKVSRITGLDPALPLFEGVTEPEDRLDSSDAEFVEAIHTCAGALGMSARVGHADFYPNGGTPFQPGCCCIQEIVSACSHGRSHKYFAESILSKRAFQGVKCETWRNFKDKTCSTDLVPMGESTPTTARGVFFLQTNSEAPFGLGLDGLTFNP